MRGEPRKFRGRHQANKLAEYLCTITEGMTVRAVADLAPGSSSAWGTYLNGSVLIPKDRLAALLQALFKGDATKLEIESRKALPLWKAAYREAGQPDESEDEPSSALVSLQGRLIAAMDGRNRAELAAAKANATVGTLRQMGAALETVISSKASQLRLAVDRHRAELELQLAQARQRLQRTESELEKAQRRRYTAEQAQQALTREVLEAREQIARLERKAEAEAEAMAYLPAPFPVPEPSAEVLLDAIDDELESIAHDGAEADEELADLTQQAHLDIEEHPAEAGTHTVQGTVIARSEHPDATQQDGAGGASRTVLDKNVTSTSTTEANSSDLGAPAFSRRIVAPPSRMWLGVHVLVGLIAATLWAGFTAAVQQDPGPAIWKMFIYGAGTLVVFLLVWIVTGLAVLELDTHEGGGINFVLSLVIAPGALLAGLVLPWLLGSDLWGRWLPDALGVL
ncbi:hypothetical protein AB0M68_34550 [Streptomyces sp. NPDC051453]|uniref:hypothetical protein n=1 Tax=Streptomyces sp. NPDC051453 TaxID=3154941 RepID=UPI0034149488